MSDAEQAAYWKEAYTAMASIVDAKNAELAESQAYALQLERALGEAWTPVPDGIYDAGGGTTISIMSVENPNHLAIVQRRKGNKTIGEIHLSVPDFAICRRTSSSPTVAPHRDVILEALTEYEYGRRAFYDGDTDAVTDADEAKAALAWLKAQDAPPA